MTAGDDRVCEQCIKASQGGRYYQVNWFMPAMPLHPGDRCQWGLIMFNPFPEAHGNIVLQIEDIKKYTSKSQTLSWTQDIYTRLCAKPSIYHNGEDLTKSPVAEWGRQTVTAGHGGRRKT